MVRLHCLMSRSVFYVDLAREGPEGNAPFRSGAITPDGLIDEDFEKELGTPSVRISYYFDTFVAYFEGNNLLRYFSFLSLRYTFENAKDKNLYILGWGGSEHCLFSSPGRMSGEQYCRTPRRWHWRSRPRPHVCSHFPNLTFNFSTNTDWGGGYFIFYLVTLTLNFYLLLKKKIIFNFLTLNYYYNNCWYIYMVFTSELCCLCDNWLYIVSSALSKATYRDHFIWSSSYCLVDMLIPK